MSLLQQLVRQPKLDKSREVDTMAHPNFDKLVKDNVITDPNQFSEEERTMLDQLNPNDVAALKRIRDQVGDKFLKDKTTGATPSAAIVF